MIIDTRALAAPLVFVFLSVCIVTRGAPFKSLSLIEVKIHELGRLIIEYNYPHIAYCLLFPRHGITYFLSTVLWAAANEFGNVIVLFQLKCHVTQRNATFY